jgi:hypothetical protein
LYLLDRDFFAVIEIVPNFLFERIFGAYSEAHAHIIKIFSESHDLFYGKTFANPAGIFPYEPINLAQYLGYLAHGSSLENYSYPSYSEGFANFGWLGFYMIVLMMFAQITIFQIIFKECKKNTINLTIYVIFIEKIFHYGNEPIQLIFAEELILFIMIVLILDFFIFKLIKK